MKEKALSCAGLRDLRLIFSPAWLGNFVAACGLARSTAAYGGLRRRLWGLVPMLTGTPFPDFFHPTAVKCIPLFHDFVLCIDFGACYFSLWIIFLDIVFFFTFRKWHLYRAVYVLCFRCWKRSFGRLCALAYSVEYKYCRSSFPHAVGTVGICCFRLEWKFGLTFACWWLYLTNISCFVIWKTRQLGRSMLFRKMCDVIM